MHPNNPYHDNPPDFTKLASDYPSFWPFVKNSPNGPTIDFKDAAALRELTRCLLKKDFALDVVLPENRLCPTLANRLDYLYLLLDIHTYLNSLTPASLKALDIGTGACAIYAILLARIHPSASVVATELDYASYDSAVETIRRNDLISRVKIHKAPSESSPLFDAIAYDADPEPFTFVLCNPPFYESASEMEELTSLKTLPSHAAPTAATNELMTPGGEVSFIGRMISESTRTRDRCLWYTSLIGKASSIPPLIDALKTQHIDNYVLLGMRQAHTVRWIIGWSFTDIRLPDSITRPLGFPSIAKYLPPPNTWTYRPLERTGKVLRITTINEIVDAALRAAGVDAGPDENTGGTARVVAPRAISWTRAARRKGPGESSTTPLLRARIRVMTTDAGRRARSPPAKANEQDVTITLDWLQGRDRNLVDGFWAFLVRKMGDAVRAA